MSLRAILQIAVQLDSFRNVDLPKQGLYQLRVQIYHCGTDIARKYIAYPFSMLRGEKTSKAGKGKVVDYYNIAPSKILEDSHTFCSRLFMVRFAEENIELQDICQFRTEIDVLPLPAPTGCYMELELFFCDISSMGPPELFTADVFF